MELRFLAAIHETAHAVAALSFPALPQPTAVSIRRAGDVHGFMQWALQRERLCSRARLEEACVVILSGMAAAERAGGEVGRGTPLELLGAGADVSRAGRLLLEHGVSAPAAAEIIRRATLRARGLVEQLWPLIRVLASHLDRVETIDGAGIAQWRDHLGRFVLGEAEADEKALACVRIARAEVGAAAAVNDARRTPLVSRRQGRVQ